MQYVHKMKQSAGESISWDVSSIEIPHSNRVYYPGNFFMYRIGKVQKGTRLMFELNSKDDTLNTRGSIENFSPTFDKRNPSPVIVEREPVQYIGVKFMEDKNPAMRASSLDILKSIDGIEYNLDLVEEIVIFEDSISSSIISTLVPIELYIVHKGVIPIVIRVSESHSGTQFYFFSKKESCQSVYPLRSKIYNEELQIEVIRYIKEDYLVPILTVRPSYFSVLRESAMSHFQPILYLSFVLVFLNSLTTSFIVTMVIPLIVLLMHTSIVQTIAFHKSLELSIVDVLVIYGVSQLFAASKLVYWTFSLANKLIKLPCCGFYTQRFFVLIAQIISASSLILALITRNHLFLLVPLIIQFLPHSVQVQPQIFRLQLILLLFEVDKIVIDAWRVAACVLQQDDCSTLLLHGYSYIPLSTRIMSISLIGVTNIYLSPLFKTQSSSLIGGSMIRSAMVIYWLWRLTRIGTDQLYHMKSFY